MTPVSAPRKHNALLGPSPVVLVTGASTGIGLALAHQLRARSELRLVLTAREHSLPRLREAGFEEDERLWLRPLDINQGEARLALIDEVHSSWGGVDVLVNNAAVAYRAVTEHLEPDEAVAQLATNFLAPMELTRLVLPLMRARRRGRIVNVSSVSGMMAMPTMGAYSASKFALEGASESLWYELKPWNVHVTLVQPGFINSQSFRRVVHSRLAKASMRDPDDPYHPVYASMTPFIERLMQSALASPESVARRIVRTLDRAHPPLRISASVDARLFFLLRRLLPRRLYHRVLYHALPGVNRWGPRKQPEAPPRPAPDPAAPETSD